MSAMARRSSCESCAAAERNPRTGLFHAGCNECRTRQLAHGWPTPHGAGAGSMPREYRAAVESIRLAGEPVADAHERVKAWGERIFG